MNFYIMTLFPEMVSQVLATSILGRAISQGYLSIQTYNIRDYTESKHKKVDDYPYGGGAGMLMQAQPVYDCYLDILNKAEIGSDEKVHVVYLTPTGKVFSQELAAEFSACDHVILLCGHYEGIDQRVLDRIVTDYVSIGDYVLTGGELPALVMVDSIARLVPGVLSNDESANTESFSDGLLEYPQYTRPEQWEGETVPEVLLSGHHANIAAWRKQQSIQKTKQMRPDLFAKYQKENR